MSGHFLRFERNTKGRDLIVGDIHGCFTRLATALDALGFDPETDRLFSTGDLVDRGPESEKSLDWLCFPWFHPVRGNHEDMAIRWPRGNMDAENYVANGGAWNVSNLPCERIVFSDAFDSLPVAIEIETAGGPVGIVHADCPFKTWAEFVEVLETPDLSNSLRKAVLETALWSRERITYAEYPEYSQPIADLRALVVGHTPMQAHHVLGNVHFIDTGAVFAGRGSAGGFFTIIDAGTLQVATPRSEVPA